jgi:hypothetical protein
VGVAGDAVDDSGDEAGLGEHGSPFANGRLAPMAKDENKLIVSGCHLQQSLLLDPAGGRKAPLEERGLVDMVVLRAGEMELIGTGTGTPGPMAQTTVRRWASTWYSPAWCRCCYNPV